MKIAFLLILLFCSNLAAQSQNCDFAISDAPTLLGLRLGMSPKEAKNVFGGKLKIKVKKEGTFFQNYIDKNPPPFLPNVRALYLRFFEAKLYQIEIFYVPQTERKTLAEFVAQLDVKLNLPNVWENEYGQAELNCKTFSLIADNVLNLRVQLTDEAIFSRFEISHKKQIKLTEKDKKTVILSILKRTNFEKANDSEIIYISKNNIPNSIIEQLTELDEKKIVYLSVDEINEKTKYGLTYWEFTLFEVKKDKVEVNFAKLFQNSEAGNSRSAGLGYDYKKFKGKWQGRIQRYILGLT